MSVSPFIQHVPIAAEPYEVARRLADQSDLFFLWSADGSGPSYVAVNPVERSNHLDPEPALKCEASTSEAGRVPRWIGLLPYESQRHLERARLSREEVRPPPHVENVSWWRFDAIVCIDSAVSVVGDSRSAVSRLALLLSRAPIAAKPASLRPLPGEPQERHLERVVEAKRLIAAGDIYQVNLARRIQLEVAGEPLDLLERLCRRTHPPFAMALRSEALTVLSTSPELFIRQGDNGHIETIPIKGTRPKSQDPEEDQRLSDELSSDPKERAELSMIIDVERNDLGKIASLGSVQVPEEPSVTSSGLVWHRVARVTAQSRPQASRAQILQALLPSGSVTGAPKVRAMETIAALESERRGLYTGAIGYINRSGRLNLSIAIRTLTVRNGIGHYFTGGGIVADSVPELEVRETSWKARQLGGLTL